MLILDVLFLPPVSRPRVYFFLDLWFGFVIGSRLLFWFCVLCMLDRIKREGLHGGGEGDTPGGSQGIYTWPPTPRHVWHHHAPMSIVRAAHGLADGTYPRGTRACTEHSQRHKGAHTCPQQSPWAPTWRRVSKASILCTVLEAGPIWNVPGGWGHGEALVTHYMLALNWAYQPFLQKILFVWHSGVKGGTVRCQN